MITIQPFALIAACSPTEMEVTSGVRPKTVTAPAKKRPVKGGERPKGAVVRRVSWRHFWNFNNQRTKTHLYWSRPCGALEQCEVGELLGRPGVLKSLCGRVFGMEDAGVEYDCRAGTWYCRRCRAVADAMGVGFDPKTGIPLAGYDNPEGVIDDAVPRASADHRPPYRHQE